jgi:hypothetical protein
MKSGSMGIALLLIAGCATTKVSDLRAPDGTNMKTVKCSSDSQKCFASAIESCKETNGLYKVVASHSNAGGTVADLFPGPVTWYGMTYVCGASDGKMPEFQFRGQPYVAPNATMNMPVQKSRSRATTTNCVKTYNGASCTTY